MASTSTTVYTSPVPGGGSMYAYKRSQVVGKNGKTENKLYCLGVGGYAASFDCFKIDGRDRIPVAIKQVSLDKRSAEKFEEYEMRGLNSIAGRSHPAIVKYIGFFKADDGRGKTRLSFVFERCPTAVAFQVDAETNEKGFVVPAEHLLQQAPEQGCDLVSNPIRRPPMTPREARFVCEQLLQALAYLHSFSPPIIHRDVKPDNALLWGVRRDEATGEMLLEVKLTDYGTVRRMDARDMTLGQGTRCFMAPEVEEPSAMPPSKLLEVASSSTSRQRRGSLDAAAAEQAAKPRATYGPSVDVFSVGATFYYLVTGHDPDANTRLDWKERFGARVPYVSPSPAGGPNSVMSGDLGSVAASAASGGATEEGGSSSGSTPGHGLRAGSLDEAAMGSLSIKATTHAAAASHTDSSRDSPSLFELARRDSQRSSVASVAASATKPTAESVFSHFFPRGSHARVFFEGLVHRAPPAVAPVAGATPTPSSAAGGAAPGDAVAAAGAASGRFTAPQALVYLTEVWTDEAARQETLQAQQKAAAAAAAGVDGK